VAGLHRRSQTRCHCRSDDAAAADAPEHNVRNHD
jgi:hypothetical protein